MQESELSVVWRPYISKFTTARFRDLDKGYSLHCGPTAMSNLVTTYAKRYGFSSVTSLEPEELFRKVASIGAKRLIFWNGPAIPLLGGTMDLAVPWYIRAVWKEFRLPAPHISFQRRATEKNLLTSLKKGAILYVELRHHPKYGEHHIIVYGCRGDGITEPVYYAADGWRPMETLLKSEDFRRSFYHEILPERP